MTEAIASASAGEDQVLSVVIPCRNEHGHIDTCLDCLLAQRLPPGWRLELVVADGCSDDGTAERIRVRAEADPRIRLVDNPGRIVSTGLNRAIAASSGAVVVRIDVHTSYADDYLASCLQVLEETGADNVGGPWVAEGREAVSRAIARAFASAIAMGGARGHAAAYAGPVDTVYLGCWRREIFDRLGGFDEDLVRNQDDEFNLRIHRGGGMVYQSPTIRSAYVPRSSLRALFCQYFQYGYWKVAVIRKHRAPASWRHLMPAGFVLGLALGWIPALWWSAWAWVYIGGVAAYALLLLLVGAGGLRRLGLAAGLVPLVIAIMHLAYGLGFLRGLGDALLGRFGSSSQVRGLTR